MCMKATRVEAETGMLLLQAGALKVPADHQRPGRGLMSLSRKQPADTLNADV